MMDSKDDTGNHQIVPSARRDLARRSVALAARGLRDLARYALDLPPTLTLDCGGGVQMEFVLIPDGAFLMGSNDVDSQKPLHEVTISKPFYMGKYAVTQEQWQAVMGSDPSHFKGAQHPVESVSWDDCQEFLEKVKDKCPQFSPILPTEAQWEYACRAGTTGAFCFGDNESELTDYAWFWDNASLRTHPVGQKKANAWGLYDMHGNVFEWCSDWFGAYSSKSETDPKGPVGGSDRVVRGGSFQNGSEGCGTSYRDINPPDDRAEWFGLRLALESK